MNIKCLKCIRQFFALYTYPIQKMVVPILFEVVGDLVQRLERHGNGSKTAPRHNGVGNKVHHYNLIHKGSSFACAYFKPIFPREFLKTPWQLPPFQASRLATTGSTYQNPRAKKANGVGVKRRKSTWLLMVGCRSFAFAMCHGEFLHIKIYDCKKKLQ